MSLPIPVANFASLAEAEFAALHDILREQTSMAKALKWFSAQKPKLVPAEMVPQDEFSYDLLVPMRPRVYLSYDTS